MPGVQPQPCELLQLLSVAVGTNGQLAIVAAYQANKTRSEVMLALGSPDGAAAAFAAFEQMGAEERAELLLTAQAVPPSEEFDSDIPF